MFGYLHLRPVKLFKRKPVWNQGSGMWKTQCRSCHVFHGEWNVIPWSQWGHLNCWLTLWAWQLPDVGRILTDVWLTSTRKWLAPSTNQFLCPVEKKKGPWTKSIFIDSGLPCLVWSQVCAHSYQPGIAASLQAVPFRSDHSTVPPSGIFMVCILVTSSLSLPSQ